MDLRLQLRACQQQLATSHFEPEHARTVEERLAVVDRSIAQPDGQTAFGRQRGLGHVQRLRHLIAAR